MSSTVRLIYILAAGVWIIGLLLISFPGTAKRWSESQWEDPLRIRTAPQFTRLKSDAAFRAFGVGLIVLAILMGYYAHSFP